MTTMSFGKGGLGPAGCWVTHKRLESWAKLAKERTKDSSGSTDSDNEGVRFFNAINTLNVLHYYS